MNMKSHFLILIAFLAILKVNHAWNQNSKGYGGQVANSKPFWQNGGSKPSQQRSTYQQQEDALPEPSHDIPKTSFTCENKPYEYGYYADIETQCGLYHICYPDGRKDSIFCGEKTVFNQKILSCDYIRNTDCANSERYWSANEQLGKPGAQASWPGQNQAPISSSKTSRKNNYSRNRQTQYQGGFQPSFPQQEQPVKQYQQQPSYQQPQQSYQQPQQSYQQPQQSHQQPQQTSNAYVNEDNGFVNEPVKKIKPTYKVVKSQQQAVYRPNSNRVPISPAKSKIVQQPIQLDEVGQNYQQSDSYFSQQQTSGSVKQSSHSQQNQSPATYRQQSSNQKQSYSQNSNSPNAWKPTNRPKGNSYNDANQQQRSTYQQESSLPEPSHDIPKTSFTCENKPYDYGFYADTETQCGVYHVCWPDGRKESFYCGETTVFNQKILSCDYQRETDCANSERYWSANEQLVRPAADYGPQRKIRK